MWCIVAPQARRTFALRDYGVEGQIGLEETPAAYVEKMVAVFREVRRILHPSGVLWLNLGDSYAQPGQQMRNRNGKNPDFARPCRAAVADEGRNLDPGAKPKDLIGIPWRVAFALQADGWYLRQDIIWSKPNPMPESVQDRCTKAHEYVFLLAKEDRYFFDAQAIAERADQVGRVRADRMGGNKYVEGVKHSDGSVFTGSDTRNKRSVWKVATRSYKGAHFATWPPKLVEPMILAGTSAKGVCPHCGEPWRRVVRKVRRATRPGTGSKVTGDTLTDGNRDPERHVTATETVGWEPRCVCGTDLRPGDLEVIESPTGERVGTDPSLSIGRAGMNRPRGEGEGVRPMTRYEQRKYAEQLRACPAREALKAEVGAEAFAHYVRTDRSGGRPVPADVLVRWLAAGHLVPVPPPSAAAHEPVPAIVFDPFAGSGTTLAVAVEHGRRALGTELNPEYLPLIEQRMNKIMPRLFAGV